MVMVAQKWKTAGQDAGFGRFPGIPLKCYVKLTIPLVNLASSLVILKPPFVILSEAKDLVAANTRRDA